MSQRLPIQQTTGDGFTDGEVPGWDDTNGLFVPKAAIAGLTSDDDSVTITDNGDGTLDLAAAGGGGGSGVVETIVAGTGISVDDTDPANPVVSATGSGGSSGVLLLDYTTDPDSDVPGGTDVGTIVYMKAGTAAPTTWDFRSLGALPTGWARRGVASETFDSAGMSATYAAGQAHYYSLGSTVATGTLEAKIISGPTSGAKMLGPQIFGPSNVGGASGWYAGSPVGALLFGVNSSHQYDSTFQNGGGTIAYPAWFRVRFDGTKIYGSYSLDGTSWSAEVSMSKALGGINELSVGSILGSNAYKVEYMKWSPGDVLAGGLVGWWDGSTVVAFA